MACAHKAVFYALCANKSKEHFMKQQIKKTWGGLVLGALVTGAITIMYSLLMDYCTATRKSLSYTVQASGPVEKDSVQWRIYNMDLLNDGDATVEDIVGLIQFNNQRIAAYKFKGSPTLSIQDSISTNAYHIRIASLNRMEKLADFRAKGLSAIGRTSTGWRDRPFALHAVLLIAGSAAVTIIVFMVSGRIGKKRNKYN